MATYDYGQLEQLWQNAGGSSKLAPIMAAIALAESGGRTGATHKDSNGSTDYGLWQINSIHGYNPAKLLSSAGYNASAAVAVERSSGLHAWSTYNSGAYKKYLAGGSSIPAGWGLPYNPTDTKPTQIDQGVDFVSSSPYVAVAPGRVVHIDHNFYNGTPAVYIRLDQPVSVNGHQYKAVYYSETPARVHVGQHVKTGQIVSGPGDAEIGFAAQFGSSSSSWLPAGHNQFSGSNQTQAGKDFSSLTVKKSGSGGGVLSVLSNIGSGIVQIGSGNPIGGEITATGGTGGLASQIPGVSQLTSIGDFFTKLSSAAFWLRASEVVGGIILVLLGLYLLAKQVGLGGFDVPLPSAATGAADTAAAQAETAQMTQQFRANEAKERRAEEAHQSQLEERSARADLARARAETARTNRQPRVIHQHYTDTPTTTRRRQFAARASDPATNEIPF